MSTRLCPYCSSETGIRIMLYGMPLGEPDYAIYSLGGCCIFDDMPKYECVECGWKGFKTLRGKNSLNRGKAIANKD